MDKEKLNEEGEEYESPAEEDEARKKWIRTEAEKLSEEILNQEARDHFIRAGTELLLAVDSLIPYDRIPPDVKEHYLGAKKETILLIKALLDAQVQVVDEISKQQHAPPAGLRKIDLE